MKAYDKQPRKLLVRRGDFRNALKKRLFEKKQCPESKPVSCRWHHKKTLWLPVTNIVRIVGRS